MADSYKGDEPDETAEIEITPQMIEAGIEAYWEFEHDHDAEDRIVSRVFRAMHKASRASSSEASWYPQLDRRYRSQRL